MNNAPDTAGFPITLINPESADRQARVDVIVIGAGVAGLAFALSVPADVRVALLTKGNLGESNTRWAQGGLSAAIGGDDTIELHEQDTIYAGAGLSDPEAVHDLVADGPMRSTGSFRSARHSIGTRRPASLPSAERPHTAGAACSMPAETRPALKSSAPWSRRYGRGRMSRFSNVPLPLI